MAALYLRTLIKNEGSYISRYFSSTLVQPVKRTIASQSWEVVEQTKKQLLAIPTQAFCTYEGAEEKPKGKKINPSAKKTIETIGRKIPHRIIQLIDENGENQGTVHRADAIRLIDEKGVKLVLLEETADPPVYRLMSGQQVHEERLKLRERQKASSKNGPVKQKELTFSTAIGKHDLDAKIKQIEQWIDKKHHVRVTVEQRNVSDGPEKMLVFFGQLLNAMPGKAAYLSQPRIVKEGRSTCVLRHMSDREIQEYKKKDKVQKDNGNETAESDTLEK